MSSCTSATESSERDLSTPSFTFSESWPLEDTGPFDTVLGQTWRVGDGADRESCWRSEHIETTLVARSDGWKNDPSLSLKACNRNV